MCAMADRCTPAGELLDAARDALAAYRAIFGRSAWNDRDRRAFDRLQTAIEAPRPARESLRTKLRRKGVGGGAV